MKKLSRRDKIIGGAGGVLLALVAIGLLSPPPKHKPAAAVAAATSTTAPVASSPGSSTTTVASTQAKATTSTTRPSATVSGLAIGALNPAVTQTTIGSTICVSGWTTTIRPSSSYTTSLKIQQLATLGYADQNPADFEEDHIIPLELGGSPTDTKNLRPELWPSARTKDTDENRLHAAVCAGSMTLDAGRQEMARYASAENPDPQGTSTTTVATVAPTTSTTSAVAATTTATALCNDGSYWYAAEHRGACSRHGGVKQFYS